MAVVIRLRREGALNRPYFKVVVTDKRSPRDGKFVEIVGTYDPKKRGLNSTLKLERIEYWISKGAQPSDTVRSLIKKNKDPEAAAKKMAAAEAKKAAKPKPAPKAEAAPAAAAAEPAPASAPAPAAPAAESAPAKSAPETSATPAAEEKSAS
ncbi:MAG TPA: 30S ribosomal protein S16 [Chthoniobacterales bacterium]|nr:30S ribosomal protein S16 [Chthoniobacterales bacterium]